MSKVVLNSSEISQILVDYLVSQGKLTARGTNVVWHVDRWNVDNCSIEFAQDDTFKIEPGDTYIFTTTTEELRKYSGTKIEVLRALTKDECDIDDVGNMYRVRFADGYERDVFEDELTGNVTLANAVKREKPF